MFKFIFLFSSFIYSYNLLAQPILPGGSVPKEMEIRCITEPLSTSFIAHSDQEKLKVRLINSNGVEYMPISSTLITSHDLESLKRRAEALKNLGSVSEFEFDLSQCTVFSDNNFMCYGKHQFKVGNGEVIEAASFSSRFHTTKSMGYIYEQTEISASFKIKGEEYDVMMKYSPEECSLFYRFK